MPADIVSFAGVRSGSQYGSRNPRRMQTTFSIDSQYTTNILANFKRSPSFKPEDFLFKCAFMGRGCSCFSDSCDEVKRNFDVENMCMCDVLNVKTEMRKSNILERCFSKLIYTLKRPYLDSYPDVSHSVLSSRRVADAVKRNADVMNNVHHEDAVDVAKKSAYDIMLRMKASMSTVFIKFTGWFLLKFLSVILRGVLVHRGQISTLKEISEKGLPMIYLPLHRSHLDYILVTFILWHYDIRPPYVAAGDNMHILFYSAIMKRLGGFFIRRKLDNGCEEHDYMYRAILFTYIVELLRKNESLEFFIEGSRSRTGLANIPKGGLLSILVDAWKGGVFPDAYIVPVSLSYEKLIEGDFCNDQMGKMKREESFWGACKAILLVLGQHFGRVRVDFAQPFSLKEFLHSSRNYPSVSNYDFSSTCHFINSGNSNSGINQQQCDLSPSTSHVNSSEKDAGRQLVTALASHTVYSSIHVHAPMATHVLAFLFLTKHRHGTTVGRLAKDLDWLKNELFMRNVDVGFHGDSKDVVLYARCLLTNKLVHRVVSREGQVSLLPNLSLPGLFQLSYLANTLTATFLIESIIACAIVCECHLMLSTWTPHQQMTDVPVVSRVHLLDTAQLLVDVLRADFIVVPPCCVLLDVLNLKLDDFVTCQVLQVEGTEVEETDDCEERRHALRIYRSIQYENEGDEYLMEEDKHEGHFKVRIDTVEACSKLQFLHAVLSPVLESYFLTACFISQHLHDDIPEDDFVSQLGIYARDKATNGLVMHPESCGLLTLKNAVRAFRDLCIIDTYKAANLNMIAPSNLPSTISSLHKYINLLKVSRY